jgi:isopenicillin N synthase-like dioxygenase
MTIGGEIVDVLVGSLLEPRAETLNTFHALRDGHPLGINNPYKYRNALAMWDQAKKHYMDSRTQFAERLLQRLASKEWKENAHSN